MKLIANENFQFRGMHRAGVTLTVPESMLKEEIGKGKHPTIVRKKERWMSGLIQHTTPANQETADFIEKHTKVKVSPVEDKSNENDDSDEIREIRAEFESLGKAFDKRWQINRLRNEIEKARREAGEQKKSPGIEQNIEE